MLKILVSPRFLFLSQFLHARGRLFQSLILAEVGARSTAPASTPFPNRQPLGAPGPRLLRLPAGLPSQLPSSSLAALCHLYRGIWPSPPRECDPGPTSRPASPGPSLPSCLSESGPSSPHGQSRNPPHGSLLSPPHHHCRCHQALWSVPPSRGGALSFTHSTYAVKCH